jgi:hypothetical protein
MFGFQSLFMWGTGVRAIRLSVLHFYTQQMSQLHR